MATCFGPEDTNFGRLSTGHCWLTERLTSFKLEGKMRVCKGDVTKE